MPNIATVLKEEIARVARKEVRAETLSLKKASAQYRAEIAALKRRLVMLDRQVARLGKAVTRKGPADRVEKASSGLRFSAKGLATLRQRLGLTAAAMGALLGVSAQSVYKWEDGKTRPRASQLPAIAAARKLNKKEAATRLSELTGQAQ